MKVALHYLGCKVNAYEIDSMKQQLIEAGYEIVPFKEGADIYVINTCTVTNIADRKSRQTLHRAKKFNPNAIVIATGCYAQSAKEELDKDECIDIVLGNNYKSKIVEAISNYIEDKKVELFDDINNECEYEALSVSKILGHTRAYIKIQDGCNHFCSYCIIPYTRGRVRSRNAESIKEEVKNLVSNGSIKEIILTGIQLSAYGFDLKNKNALLELILELSKIEGLYRIRLGSLEPNVITDEFCKKLSENTVFCPHFHLSMQSGSDTVLKRMNRHYDCLKYSVACETIRKYFDNPAITTDIIVGFPGETSNEFNETIKYVNEIKLAQAHIFKYSKRKGTRAEIMPNQVSEQIKSERSNILIEVCDQLEIEYLNSFIGRDEEILIEDDYIYVGDDIYSCGHTKSYIKVAVAGEFKINTLIKVKIYDIDKNKKILLARSYYE